tara:strand:- start:332 stop:715 length:384 start_codon:yes stop_codon:yes gene_type:complete
MKIEKITKQFFSFFSIGIVSFIIDFTFYNIFFYTFQIDVNLSKALSYIMGFLNSYVLNKKITFKSQSKGFREPIAFLFLYLSSMVVNYYAHKFLIEIYSGYIPFFGATSLSVIINFLGLKFLVFKKK